LFSSKKKNITKNPQNTRMQKDKMGTDYKMWVRISSRLFLENSLDQKKTIRHSYFLKVHIEGEWYARRVAGSAGSSPELVRISVVRNLISKNLGFSPTHHLLTRRVLQEYRS
jgi:hypothetical protein